MKPKVIKNPKAHDAAVNRKKADALKATKKKEADAKAATAAIKAKAVKAKAAAKEKAKADAKAAADAETANKGKGRAKVCLPPFRACTCWSSCLVWAGQGRRRRTYRRNGGSLAKQRQPAASGKIGGSGSTSTGGGKGENGGKGKEH